VPRSMLREKSSTRVLLLWLATAIECDIDAAKCGVEGGA
jgi:hypothetical protein